MNPTLVKFGYPHSIIHECRHWCVLLRPAQATLGALILGAKSAVTALPDLTREAFKELHDVTGGIERTLMAFRRHDRINYLMLMMVDPHVHFHVLPRYASAPEFHGVSFADDGWPGSPDLKSATAIDDELRNKLLQDLQALWPRT